MTVAVPTVTGTGPDASGALGNGANAQLDMRNRQGASKEPNEGDSNAGNELDVVEDVAISLPLWFSRHLKQIYLIPRTLTPYRRTPKKGMKISLVHCSTCRGILLSDTY